MKVLAITLMLAGVVVMAEASAQPRIFAQSPAGNIAITIKQQELVQAAAEAESTAARELQLAQANYRAAQAKTLQIIYQVMAEQKLSPTEYTWKAVDGKLVFVKLPEKKGGEKP